MHHNEVPFNSKGKALLSGMVYCAHCGSKLVLTTSSGRRAKGEPERETRIRYACHYKIRHSQDCDRQTGYSGEKLDGIIDIVDKKYQNLAEKMKLVKVCPADLYKLDDSNDLKFDYIDCLECGACRIVGLGKAVTEWNYPCGSMGVEYRRG